MPIYVYRCERCKERFERLVPMSENFANATCPHCGAEDARKQISAFATPQRGTSTASGQSCAPTGG